MFEVLFPCLDVTLLSFLNWFPPTPEKMWLLEAFTVQVVQLVANFFWVLCGAERLVYSLFISAIMLRAAPCYPQAVSVQ